MVQMIIKLNARVAKVANLLTAVFITCFMGFLWVCVKLVSLTWYPVKLVSLTWYHVNLVSLNWYRRSWYPVNLVSLTWYPGSVDCFLR